MVSALKELTVHGARSGENSRKPMQLVYRRWGLSWGYGSSWRHCLSHIFIVLRVSCQGLAGHWVPPTSVFLRILFWPSHSSTHGEGLHHEEGLQTLDLWIEPIFFFFVPITITICEVGALLCLMGLGLKLTTAGCLRWYQMSCSYFRIFPLEPFL